MLTAGGGTQHLAVSSCGERQVIIHLGQSHAFAYSRENQQGGIGVLELGRLIF